MAGRGGHVDYSVSTVYFGGGDAEVRGRAIDFRIVYHVESQYKPKKKLQ